MAVTFENVKSILSDIASRGSIPLSTSPHGAFWSDYDSFVGDPTFFDKQDPLQSPFYVRLTTQSMPLGGPYITDPGYVLGQKYQDDLKEWLTNGFPNDGEVTPTEKQFVATWDGESGKDNGVKNLFTATDISHMKAVAGRVGRNIYLDDYDNVKLNAFMIFGMVKTQRMPPGNPWSDHYLETFQKWMDANYPRT